ncbi:transcriptional regulator, partial [Motilibacter sp. E257]|nr:transcriptional regulator [Motilibacter deserti]
GTRRLYSIDPSGLRAATAWLAGLADPLEPFAQPLDALATEVARGRRARRAGAAGELSPPAAGEVGRPA